MQRPQQEDFLFLLPASSNCFNLLLSLSRFHLTESNGWDIDPSAAVLCYQWASTRTHAPLAHTHKSHFTFNEFICLHVFLFAPKMFFLVNSVSKNYRLFVQVSKGEREGKVHFTHKHTHTNTCTHVALS